MGLSQDIVIVNEFSHKSADGNGSRGNTPGKYVMEYMNREGATETLHPIRLTEEDAPEVRYSVKQNAIESSSNLEEARKGLKNADKYAGRAFNNVHVSLTDDALRKDSAHLQDLFDQGHTVMKTVISFTEPYLQSQNLIPQDLYLHNRGDYKGEVDQLRLRLSIMNGLSALSRQFDNLQYIGAIQVDTRHIHCHLAMVDEGIGKLGKQGYQKGSLTNKDKRILRQNIDEFLLENQDMAHFASGTIYDRQNTRCFLKEFTHKIMNREGTQQLLLSILPEDTSLWSSTSLEPAMQRPNAVAKDLVRSVAAEPNSGYNEALRAEVNHRLQGNETDQDRRLIMNASADMIEDACVDSVYNFLEQIPKEDRVIRTPMLQIMSMDYHKLAQDSISDPILEFGFKLRSYNSRLQYHKDEREKYHTAIQNFEINPDASQAARALLRFYEEEEDYNTKLMSKYQHYLTFLPENDFYMDAFNDLKSYGQTLQSMQLMAEDNTFANLSPTDAEDYGIKTYHMHGGKNLHNDPSQFMQEIRVREVGYQEMKNRLSYRLANYGISIEGNYGDIRVKKKPIYDLEEVAGLDLHHLDYDFPTDIKVSDRYVRQFLQAADRRVSRLNDAEDYLRRTGQDDQVHLFPTADIKKMEKTADGFRKAHVLETKRHEESAEPPRATTKLDLNYEPEIENVVKNTISEFEFGG